jgi:hypothetical protein
MAAAVVAATIEVDGFREFWLTSGWLDKHVCELRIGFWSWLAPAGSIPERTMLESVTRPALEVVAGF